MPIFSITNLITYRQLSHGSNYRSVKLHSDSIEKEEEEEGGKKSAYTDGPKSTRSKGKRGDVGKYLRTRGGKLSPKENLR